MELYQLILIRRAWRSDFPDRGGPLPACTRISDAPLHRKILFVLRNGLIEFTVDDRTAQDLGTDTTFAVAYSPDETLLRRLEVGLAQIFSGTRCQFSTDVPRA